MTPIKSCLPAVVAFALFTACSPAPDQRSSESVVLTIPAGPESTGPRLSYGPDGSLILSWMEPDAVDVSLRFSRLTNGEWAEPQTVVSGAPLFVNWADLPSVVPVSDGHLVAHWLSTRTDSYFAYDIQVAQSVDDGATWQAPMTPHTDNTPTEHGFVSIFADDDKTGLVWLDGRNMVNEVTDDPVASGMTLRGAFIDIAATLEREHLLDELVCDCCQTDVAVSTSGPIAIYRDRSVNEIRDIGVTRFVNGRWLPTVAVATDNWEIAGCPVNGPAIAARGNDVVAAWFTAADSAPKVRFAASTNGGDSFSAAIDVVSDNTLGRVGVAVIDTRQAAVSWLQNNSGGNASVMVRMVYADGKTGNAIEVSDTAADFSVPQMARVGDQLIFAWTEALDDADRIASASLAIDALRN